MKKLLTTTAIVALVGSSVSVLAETKITGSIEQTMISTSYDLASSSKSATGIGQETNLSIDSSKKLTNGWTLSGGFRLENGAIDSTTIKLSNGGFSIHTGADTGSNIHGNLNPKVGDQPGDIISGELASDGFKTGPNPKVSDPQAHDVQHVGVEFENPMGKLFMNYAPGSGAAAIATAGAVTEGGATIVELGFQGSLGVSGLNLLVGQETIYKDLGTYDDDVKNNVVSLSYTLGNVSVGGTIRSKDDGIVSTTAADKVKNFSVAYKVSDDVSVSYENVKVGYEGALVDDKYNQVSVGYNFGGLGISLDYVEADNVAGEASNDMKAIQLRTVYGF